MSGFLSGALGSLMGGGQGQGQVGASGVAGLLGEAFNAAGGVSGIMSKFNQAGMGDKVQSWAGNGGNMSLAADEVTKVFPPAQIESFAAAHGVPAGMAAGLLAHLIPHAVDSQTSQGASAVGDQDDPFADGQSTSQGQSTGQGQTAPQQSGQPSGQGFNFGGLVQRLMGES